MYTYEHPRPAVTVDIVVFILYTGLPYVLLIQRAAEPFIGMWALPGGFVQMDEGLDEAGRRELEEETGLKVTHLEQLYTFGRPDRDPRERVITVVYLVLLPENTHKKVEAGTMQPGLIGFQLNIYQLLPLITPKSWLAR